MDNENAMDTLKGYAGSVLTYSIHNEQAHCHAANIVWERGLPRFDVVIMGQVYTHVELQVGGEHNISNALAAAGAGWMLGVSGEDAANGLATFTGAGRRMERKGTYNGAPVFDDYAHHPGELSCLIDAVRTQGYKRVVVAFQPHTYTRTHALFEDFIRELNQRLVTELNERKEEHVLADSLKNGNVIQDIESVQPIHIFFRWGYLAKFVGMRYPMLVFSGKLTTENTNAHTKASGFRGEKVLLPVNISASDKAFLESVDMLPEKVLSRGDSCFYDLEDVSFGIDLTLPGEENREGEDPV
jgi:hypothetical protein